MVNSSELKTVMDRVLKVPDSFRRLDVTGADTQRIYGIDPDLLENLLDLGLSHNGTGETVRFDRLDLENIGVALRLPSKHWLSARMWARYLEKPHAERESFCKLCVSWRCPEPGHDGDCLFFAGPQLLTKCGDAARDISGARSLEIDAELEDEKCAFGDSFQAVADAAQELTFHRIPNNLVNDYRFVTETLLADCRSATRHLIKVAVSAGLEMRPASGFFVGFPFPAAHTWLELRHEERWVAADPFFLTTLQRWGLVNKEKWPITSSPQRVLWRWETSDSMPPPLILHGENGRAVTSLIAIRQNGR
ncbi:hypothetical protein [Streptomyces sp. NPDC059802]|uniref:hypothetical protein n=1 Tax=Streptomyces sp. NPDC059802 TaxID=3346952 RepID=UPI00366887ED